MAIRSSTSTPLITTSRNQELHKVMLVFERTARSCIFVCLCVHLCMIRAQSIRPGNHPGQRRVSLRHVHCNLSRYKHGDASVNSGNCSDHLRMSLCCQLAAEFQ